MEQQAPNFADELSTVINRHSKENGSNTPDFILAEFLADCLSAFDAAVERRTNWGSHVIPLDHLSALLPQSYYMDPPDGGDVPVMEQLRRMSDDAARYRFIRNTRTDIGCCFTKTEGVLSDRAYLDDFLTGEHLDKSIDDARSKS